MWFNVKADLTYDFAAPTETLLLLQAAGSPDQAVHSETLTTAPDSPIARLDDSVTGERRAVFLAEGRCRIVYDAVVEVLARDANLKGAEAISVRDLPGDTLRYLMGSRYCPSDRFERFVDRQFAGLEGGDKVQAILDWIGANVDYEIGTSDAVTTAMDTFVDRAGVCRDFAHLTIALCRAADIDLGHGVQVGGLELPGIDADRPGGDVGGPAQGDGQVREVAADSGAVHEGVHGGGQAVAGADLVVQVAGDPVDDGLHLVAALEIAEAPPHEPLEAVRRAVAAAVQEAHRIGGQVADGGGGGSRQAPVAGQHLDGGVIEDVVAAAGG